MAGKVIASPNAYQRFAQRILALKPVSLLMARILHHADGFALKLTRGKHTFPELVGLPIIQLTAIGARSGQPRTLPLVGLSDGDKFILIGTNFGQRHNPSWYYNLRSHPECIVRFNGQSGAYIARETEGDEREHYWRLALSFYMGYEKYRVRAAHRRIPVMVLEPKA
jgi:deazaflavin-dependent oxidoreductase (nitroreductase family)